MKKIIASALLFAGLTAVADVTDYILYWQVKPGNNDAASSVMATIGAAKNGEITYLSTQAGGDIVNLSSTGGGTDVIGSLVDPSMTGYEFFVEVFSETASVGISAYYAYNDLLDFISPNNGTAAKSVWTPTIASTTSVPEPTSAVLLLMGLAGLALKRKRA